MTETTTTVTHTIVSGHRNPAEKAPDGSIIPSTFTLLCSCGVPVIGADYDDALDHRHDHASAR